MIIKVLGDDNDKLLEHKDTLSLHPRHTIKYRLVIYELYWLLQQFKIYKQRILAHYSARKSTLLGLSDYASFWATQGTAYILVIQIASPSFVVSQGCGNKVSLKGYHYQQNADIQNVC